MPDDSRIDYKPTLNLPDTPFPHLPETVQELKRLGWLVSIDSGNLDELRAGAEAGADFLFSLTEDTLDLAFETDAVPVLIPAHHGELDGLLQACERLTAAGRPFLADPILDPIHFGLILTLNLMIGLLHPPLGMVLFVLARVAKLSVERTTMAILPWLVPLLLALVAVTYIPELTLWLPRTMGVMK